MTVEIHSIKGTKVTFTQDGRPNSWDGSTAQASAEDLRKVATSHRERAADCLRRAEVMEAVAEVKENKAQEHAEAASKQRRERAAATRAHNADPFGFKAAGYS